MKRSDKLVLKGMYGTTDLLKRYTEKAQVRGKNDIDISEEQKHQPKEDKALF